MEAATTLLITKKCPLNCRYCNLAEEMECANKNNTPDPSYEEIEEVVIKFLNNNKNAETKVITITGGEPFVRWDVIKKLIEKYGQDCTFDFNTSGYLLTKEMLEWLSHYNIRWNLSVDGGELVTNYLRPLRNPQSTSLTYWQKLKEITPTLLYYFPYAYCKIIISKNTIRHFYNNYLELEQIGFKKMYIILDLKEREDEHHKGTWTEEDYAALQEQINLVAKQRAIGMKIGVERMEIVQMEEIIASLLKDKDPTPYDLMCKILDVRELNSMLSEEFSQAGNCYEVGLHMTSEEFERTLVEGLQGCHGKCPNNPDCPFFKHCIVRTCPKDNIAIRKGPWNFEFAFCHMTECIGNAALYFLNLCNEYCNDSIMYQKYVGGKVS